MAACKHRSTRSSPPIRSDRNHARSLTAKRVKRVATGYANANAKGNAVEGLGGGFQFCRLSADPLLPPRDRFAPTSRLPNWLHSSGSQKPARRALSPTLSRKRARENNCRRFWVCLRDAASTCSTTVSLKTNPSLAAMADPEVIHAAANRTGARCARRHHLQAAPLRDGSIK